MISIRAFVLAVALLSMGCYTAPPEALDLIEGSIATTKGHSNDPHDELPPVAEAAFLADHDAWQKVRYMVYGIPVDPDVAERQANRTGVTGHGSGQ